MSSSQAGVRRKACHASISAASFSLVSNLIATIGAVMSNTARAAYSRIRRMKLRQAPFWLDRVPPAAGRPFPRLRTQPRHEVVIVGGGLTGAAAPGAWPPRAFRSSCSRPTASAPVRPPASVGLVREDFDALFTDTRRCTASAPHARCGRRSPCVARVSGGAAAARHPVRPAPQDLLDHRRRGIDTTAAPRVRGAPRGRARCTAGLRPQPCARSGGRSTGAIKTERSRSIPIARCTRIARRRGGQGAAQVFERSDVVRIRPSAKGRGHHRSRKRLRRDRGDCRRVRRFADLRQLRRHLRPRARLRRGDRAACAAGAAAGRTAAAALRVGRTTRRFVRWLGEDRVLVAGADQAPVPARARERAIIQRTGQLMYELSLSYPAISGHRAGMGMVVPLRRDRRRPALHRHAPEFPAPPVRARPGPPRRVRLLAGRADTAAADPRRSRRRATSCSASPAILH